MTESDELPRRHQRFAVDIEAAFVLPGARKVPARTRDLSRAGICLLTREVLARGSVVTIDLVLAFGTSAFSEPLTLGARVVWCTNIAGVYQVGAMFDDLSEEQDAFLEMFLRYLDGTLAPRGVAADASADDDLEPPRRDDAEDKDDPFR